MIKRLVPPKATASESPKTSFATIGKIEITQLEGYLLKRKYVGFMDRTE